MNSDELLATLLTNPESQAALLKREPLLRLGAAVNRSRNGRGLSQRELATAAGITQRQVSLLENGRPVTTTTMTQVASALGMKLDLVPFLAAHQGATAGTASPNLIAALIARGAGRVSVQTSQSHRETLTLVSVRAA